MTLNNREAVYSIKENFSPAELKAWYQENTPKVLVR